MKRFESGSKFLLPALLATAVLAVGCASVSQNIALTTRLIAFPSQGINMTSNATSVVLKNNEVATLNIGSIVVSAPFAESDNCGKSLAPNEQCTIDITFTPSATQNYSATLTITDSAANSPQTVSLTGSGVIPISISTGQLVFPNQGIYTVSGPSAFTVTNNQGTPLNIGSIATTAPFAQTNNCGGSLAANSSCTVAVTFKPMATQSYSSSIVITDGTNTSPHLVAVNGNGIIPVTLSTANLAFPNEGMGSTSPASTFTLTNNQSAALSISSIAATAPFAETNNCGLSLAANASCTVAVTFTPTANQSYSSNIVIVESANASPLEVAVNGSGVLPVTLSTSAITFPHQGTNTTSAASTFTLTNNLSSPLSISSVAATAPFAQTNNCGTSLAASSSCTVSVTFTPTASQSYSSNIVIVDGAAGPPQQVTVSGSGVIPLSVSTTAIAFPKQGINTTSAASTVTVTNNQSTALSIASIAATAPFAETNDCGSSLAANSSCTVSLTFTPTATHSYASNIVITDGSNSPPVQVAVSGRGVVPVTLSSGAIAFSNQGINTTSPASTLTLTNNQGNALSIASIAVTAPFAQTNNCGASLAADSSCTVSVTFTPTASQSYGSNIVITDGAAGSPEQVVVSGSGVMPVTLSTSAIPFPNQGLNTTSAASTFTLTNNLSSALSIASIAATAPFAQTNTCGSSLAANSSCAVSVTFTPTANQSYVSNVVITDGAAGSPQQVAVNGDGVVPVTLSTSAMSFPNQGLNTTSAASTFSVTNNLSSALNISSIAATAPFAATNNCGASLAANSSCTVSVTFTPTANQPYSSSIVITDGAAGSPQQVSVSGTVLAGALTIAPSQVSFSNQVINTTSSQSSFTLTNNQGAAMTISSIATTAPFAETDNCGASLAANSSCTVNVTFTPTAKQAYSSNVVITDNVSGSPQLVPVSGTGVAAGAAVTPGQILFPNQGINSTSSSYVLTLSNNQSTTLLVSSIAASAPFAQTNNCGSSVAAGASCTINVTFAPTAVQYYASNVVITSNAPTPTIQIPVTGNGILPVKYTPAVGGYYFNNQITNTTSTPQIVTIINEQTTPLTFSSITGPAVFPFTTNCGDGNGGGTLAAGATCTISVSFDPVAVTKYTGNLVVSEDAYGSPISIPLQGSGISGTTGPLLTVTPRYPCSLPGQTMQFTANFADTAATPVYWYVNGVRGGNATAGTITTTGLYTAPSASASYTIRAVSQSDSSLGGSATMTVSTTPSFLLVPYVASIPPGAQTTFQAQNCNVPDPAATFEVNNIPGGNSTVGTITTAGVYTAPSLPGTYTVRTTDSTLNKTTAGQVTVFSSINADYGSRANNTAVVPAGMFGYGRGESLTSETQNALMAQAGLNESRMSAQITLVYATQTPNWTKVDPFVTQIQAAGQKAMMQLKESPPWLQPATGTCAANSVAAPTNVAEWAQMAVAYVAHMDSAFPGVVKDYEIWNEPNSSGMCAGNHLNSYLALYAAAAPLMKAQAAQDGQTIHVGGPVLSGYNSTWVNALLSNSTTAPYVDFVSYHQYFYGETGLGATWDQYNGNPSMYQEEQDPSVGAFGNYKRFYTLVAAGMQPGGASTPIYVTEFNTNWAFFQDCCRNDATYAPVFNALYITDMLDSIYNGVPQMPAQIDYFAGSAYPYFCLIGVQDSNNDCLASVGGNLTPYPQYYAFQLIAGPQYLGLGSGGYMAKTISTPTGGGGLATTAFYTAGGDALVIINPTSTAYTAIPVTLANPGLSSTQGTLYQIVDGDQITAVPISFSVSGTNLNATINVPAYSVQAISLQ